jgi:hypothetical protein
LTCAADGSILANTTKCRLDFLSLPAVSRDARAARTHEAAGGIVLEPLDATTYWPIMATSCACSTRDPEVPLVLCISHESSRRRSSHGA